MEAMRQPFLKPTQVERLMNRLVGLLVGLGVGLRHGYLLEVRGRKSGRVYATPVDLLEVGGRTYLVCPRGRAQWVRNAEAAGRVALRRGSSRREFSILAVADTDKPILLKEYLDRFKAAVQRFFPVAAGSPASEFNAIAERYPVFELTDSTTRE